MEICQHCQMYMKPFIVRDDESTKARCEFCDRTIATFLEGQWMKHRPEDYQPSQMSKNV